MLVTGRRFASLPEVREAVRLTSPYPDTAQHALAMAELADAGLWHADPAAPSRAREALRLARACGSPKALTFALTANVMARLMVDSVERMDAIDIDAALADAREAKAAAAQCGDFWAFVH